ncbi:hypothetical protein A9P82_14395 [Arachidicoccus ginsenosidimutans]|uniref:DUF3857 domain-containing protein n=1 Tax=Arachidicoccus sp. BS20 TaxID=1850526 RepID=UPI0007F11C37|nr:DUF3857 domain-containing protein [Arachidicoccus sp. BS20]ANI90374.1 hypothetical protein A9P82_14395 [Arachidicoccus sp. BS20]
MKKNALHLLAIVMTLLCSAQKNIAQDKLISFGKPDKTELELKDCDFDPGAPLECLADIGTVNYQISNAGVNIITKRRTRFKIFKESGISIADVKLRYYAKDNYEDITGIDGYVYNMDGSGNVTVSRLKKSDIYKKDVDAEYAEVSFALPDVRVGSVIEFRYTKYKKTIGNIDSWYFQHEYPVKYSAYNLIVPDYFDFNYQVNRRQEMTIKKSTDADGNWFIMHNVASVHDEPYMPGFNDYNQRVDFNLTSITPPGESTIVVGSTWQKLAEQYLDEYTCGGQLKRNVKHPSELDSLVANSKTNIDKLKTIYYYLQKNIKWNGDDDIGAFEDGGIKNAWDKKQGSTADINLLFVNWLRDYKINADPILVSTSDHGKTNRYYINMNQFNSVMAYVTVDSNTYVLNAADKYNPFGLIPYNVLFSQGLTMSKNASWITMASVLQKFSTGAVINIDIDKKGKISGFGNLTYSGYARAIEMKEVEENKLKTDLSYSKDITIDADSINVEHTDNDSLPLNINFTLSGGAHNSGNYLLIPYNLYGMSTENPFTSDKRLTAIDFKSLQSYNVMGYINIDSSLTFDELPKNFAVRTEDSSIILKRIFQKNSDQTLSYLLSVNFLRPDYTLDEYAGIKAFYKQLFTLLNERIVVKRKTR